MVRTSPFLGHLATVVLAVAVLLAVLGSLVVDDTVALADTVAGLVGALTTTVRVLVAPAAMSAALGASVATT